MITVPIRNTNRIRTRKSYIRINSKRCFFYWNQSNRTLWKTLIWMGRRVRMPNVLARAKNHCRCHSSGCSWTLLGVNQMPYNLTKTSRSHKSGSRRRRYAPHAKREHTRPKSRTHSEPNSAAKPIADHHQLWTNYTNYARVRNADRLPSNECRMPHIGRSCLAGRIIRLGQCVNVRTAVSERPPRLCRHMESLQVRTEWMYQHVVRVVCNPSERRTKRLIGRNLDQALFTWASIRLPHTIGSTWSASNHQRHAVIVVLLCWVIARRPCVFCAPSRWMITHYNNRNCLALYSIRECACWLCTHAHWLAYWNFAKYMRVNCCYRRMRCLCANMPLCLWLVIWIMFMANECIQTILRRESSSMSSMVMMCFFIMYNAARFDSPALLIICAFPSHLRPANNYTTTAQQCCVVFFAHPIAS